MHTDYCITVVITGIDNVYFVISRSGFHTAWWTVLESF